MAPMFSLSLPDHEPTFPLPCPREEKQNRMTEKRGMVKGDRPKSGSVQLISRNTLGRVQKS